MKKSAMVAAAFACGFWGLSAHSQSSFEDGAARCKAISDEAEQDRCVTQLATQTWNTDVRIDKLDNSRSTAISIFSLDALPNVRNQNGRALLAIRCLKNKTELMLGWPEYLGISSVPIKWRVDDNPILSERWRAQRDTAWANNPIAMVKTWIGKKQLLVSVGAYGKTSQTITFQLAGFEEKLPLIRDLCKW